jgi:FkbM family methyltransferase
LPDCRPAPPWWVRLGAAVASRLPAGRYRLMNLWCRRPPRPFLARAGAELGGLRFVCDLRDGNAREVCFTGRYEPQETAVVGAVLRPGGTFVDVGANWGYFSLLGASLVGPAGRVVSVEPDPRLFALLEANVAANGLANLHPLRAAASDRAGEVRLAGFDPDAGNWGVSRIAPDRPDGPDSFTAPAVSLDAALDALGVGQVDLLKMDIEGAEDVALAGMADGLRARRYARLLIELHPTFLAARSVRPESVIDRLLAAGYRAWEIRHDRQTARRAAYARTLDPASFLTPWDPGRDLGAWPHFLFAPDDPLP